MSLLFLQIASNLDSADSLNLGKSLGSALGGLAFGITILYVLIFLGLYLYFSLAFMSIGKKAKLFCPGVSWISPLITIFETAKMHWWPFPFLIGSIFLGFLVILSGVISGSFITIGILMFFGWLICMIASLIFIVMVLIWLWKTFEAVGKPGWWAIVSPIIAIPGFLCFLMAVLSPIILLFGGILVIISGIIFVILVGIAAWSR